MILPYALRLLCLCFASFFLIHVALGLSTWLGMRRIIHASDSMRPRAAVRFLLFLRLAPAITAFAVVGGLCIPSYLWLEGNAAGERVGLVCCAMALIGVAICAISLARGGRAAWISSRHSRQYEREGEKIEPGCADSPVLLVNREAPLMALTGVFRPRIVVSRGVLSGLSREQLEAAVEHEQAHRKSRDNFKRLLMALAPPFSRASATLESRWARFTEWAADDEAVNGDARRSVSLAAALVQMARMNPAAGIPPLASSLFEKNKNDELAVRIERLLNAVPRQNRAHRTPSMFLACAMLLGMAAIVVVLHPAILQAVHATLERLIQ